ncbi:hypothetical protein JT93_002456 [Salmonella enterica]|nr:hypothetical protein [Salmonella enterica]EDV3191972.1 hypothetical protein [Salmonella enterica]ELL6538023.1 hypothetical protein [Salmonella enterica]
MINKSQFFSVFFLLFTFSGCTTQVLYVGDVYIDNVCMTPITVTSYNDSGGYLNFVGSGEILLKSGGKQAWLTFNMSSLLVGHGVSDFFIDNGRDNLRVKFSDGRGEKTLNGRQVISLLKNITTQEDRQLGKTVYEISDSSICPN